MRAAEQKVLTFMEGSATEIIKYPIDLFVPADIPVYHREKRLILIMTSTPLSFMVWFPLVNW